MKVATFEKNYELFIHLYLFIVKKLTNVNFNMRLK